MTAASWGSAPPGAGSPQAGATLLRTVFRRHAGGVVVITFDDGAVPRGFTATSLASASLAPPVVVFGISNSSSCWPGLRVAGSFVVNFLDAAADAVAVRFATRGIDRFAPPVRWHRLESGEPRLDGGGAWLRATVVERLPVGDHHLVIGAVEAGGVQPGAKSALVYHDGAYHGLHGGMTGARG